MTKPINAPERPTIKLDPIELAKIGEPSWMIAIAALERLYPWLPEALRLGTLVLLEGATQSMVIEPKPEHIARMREYVETLARLPTSR